MEYRKSKWRKIGEKFVHPIYSPCRDCGADILWLRVYSKKKGEEAPHPFHAASLFTDTESGETFMESHVAHCPNKGRVGARPIEDEKAPF